MERCAPSDDKEEGQSMTITIAEMTGKELEEFLGPVAYREYSDAPEWDKVKIRKWAISVQGMSDAEFITESASRIHDSVLMERFRGNYEGIHARASACHYEARRRHRAAGHSPECRGSNLYAKGHDEVMRGQGYAPNEVSPCTCGKVKK